MQARRSLQSIRLTSRFILTASLAVAGAVAGSHAAHAQIVAGVSTFGMYSQGNAYVSNATIAPNIAIGGNFTDSSANWGVAGATSLYVDGNASLSGGNVNGAFKIGGIATVTNINQSTSDQANDTPAPPANSSNQLTYTSTAGQGTGSGNTGVNFSSSFSNFQAIDTGLITNHPGTTTTLSGGSLTFVVTGNPTTAYFNVTAANLNAASGITLTGATSTTTVIINVLAAGTTSFTFPTNSNFNGFTAGYDLFNIQTGITSFATNALVQASILAPFSAFTGDNSQGVKGDLIANSIGTAAAPISGGQIGGSTFVGSFSFTGSATAPEPGSLALLLPLGVILPALKRRRRE